MEAAVVSGAQQLEATAPGGPETEGTGASASPSLPPNTSASTLGVLTNKRIEFHLARKQYGGLGRSGDFRIETLNPDSGRKRPTSDAGLDRPADGSDYGENGLDPELSFGITFRRIVRIGAGLENLGNTCFLNSVLQCLTYTEPLAAYLQSGKHQNSCHIAGFCALCAIQKHVSRALQSSGRSLVPKDLVSNLRCISRNFRNARQEDAHEYMVNLLESMHKCCLPFGVPAESPTAYEKSLVHKIFGGRLRSQVECQQCHYRSDKFDPFLDLSLEIVKADSLPTALRNFTAAEILDGGGKHYQCQRCKEKVKAKKRLTVHKVPYVLTIHLKRFHAHDPGRKVDKKVHFDRTLDLKPFSSGSYEGDLNYSLYGVLVHLGHNTHSGHYVCFVRTSSGMWHLLNDKQVCQVSEKTVLDQKAYMLFYVRDRKTIPLQKPVDSVIQENVKATVGSDIANLFFKQISKEHTSDVSNDKKTNSALLSATVNQNEVNVLSENHQRGKSVQENSMVAMPDSLMLKAEPTMKPSSAPMLKDPVAPSSVSVTNTCPSSPSGSRKPHSATNLTGAKTSDCNMASSSCNTSRFSGDMLNKASRKMNQVVHGGVPVEVPVKDTSNRAAGDVKRSILSKDFGGKMMDADPLPSKPSCGIAQGGGFTSGSAGGEETVPKSVNSSTPATPLETLSGKAFDHKPTPSTPVTSNETLNIKASDCEPKSSTPVTANEKLNSKASACATTLKKSKKKLIRYRIPSLQLRATLFWPSLGIRKKWKHKKVKNIILDGNLLNDNCLSVESMQPLPQDMTVMNGLTNSLKKRSNFGPRESNILTKGGGRVLVGVTNEEVKVKDRPRPELAIDKKLQKVLISTSETNQQVVNKLESANRCKTNGMQTPLMRMLTRGLEETTVAHWDRVELPPSPIEDANGADLSIGYVPDEWDEEYDRGKRKKLRRSKHQFGGPNPFQEIASKKAKHDRAKRNWSSSRNPPFRI